MGQPNRRAGNAWGRQFIAFAIAAGVMVGTLLALVAVDRIEGRRHQVALHASTFSQMIAIQERLDRAL